MKTRAVLIGCSGEPIGYVKTSMPSGPVRYYWDWTIDGCPVNVKRGKLSRNKRLLARVLRREVWPCDCLIIGEK
jgi:hypothetical protein